MNAAELQQAGFSQEEISSYIAKRNLTLKSAGFSDAEIEAKYGQSEFSPANPKPANIDKFFNDGMKGVKIDPVDGDPQSNFSNILSPWINPWKSVGYSSAEALNRGVAGFATHLNTLAEYIGKKTGTEPGGIFKKAADQYNQNTDYWKKRADEVGTSFFQELVSEAIGGAIPGISEFLLNVPYAIFLGAAEAEKSGGNELGGALLSGAKRGLLGAVFTVMGPLNHYLRAPAMGITFGAQAASEGADTRDIAKSVGIGAIYSMMSPGGRYGLNEMTNNARSYLNEQAIRISSAKAKTEVEPAATSQAAPAVQGVRSLGAQPTQAATAGKYKTEVVLDSLNPTGKLFTDYSPQERATMTLGENMTTLDKAMGKSPDDIITVYRGATAGQKEIVAGDFVTTNKQLAKDYAGTGVVIEKKVKLSDIIDDKTEPLGEEYLYRPETTQKAEGPVSFAPEEGFRRTPETTEETTEPMGRNEIKQFLEEKLGIPIRTGRFTQKALGIFKTKEEVIRTKYANDIETISHETGHAIQKFLWPESIKKGAKQFAPYEEELIPIATEPRAGQDIKSEGFAEFIRLYVTDAKKAQEVAPRFYDYFNNILSEKSPEVREVLLEARKRYDIYMKQPALKRVLSQISINENPERKTNTFDDLYTATVDDLHPLEIVVREMAQGAKIPISKDPYKLARLMRGWTGKAEAFLKNKPFDFGTYKDIPGSKSLKEILDPIRDNLDYFRAYVVSKRTLELEGRKIDTGILHEDAVEIVNKYDKEFRTSFEDLKKFQDSTLDYLKQSGLIDQKAYDAMKTANADYVPFYRVMENQKGYGVGRGIQSWNPIKGIKGSWRDIQDPLESIIKNTFTYINLAEKNAVGRALVDLAKNKEGLGKFVEKIPTPIRGIEVKTEELQKWLKEIGLDGEIDPASINNLTVFRPNAFMPKDNVIQVWENGKRELYQVHPDIAKTFQALDSESTNMILRILAKPASWLRAGATLTPEFIARNPLRDQWSAFIYSKYGFVPGFDTARGLFAMAKKENLYWEWKKSGGDHSMLVSMDRDYLQDNLGELLQKYPIANIVKNPINALRILSELGEEGTRLGEFGAAKRKLGENKEAIQEAGFSSREVTLDFNRIGTKTKAVNAIIAFWNAQVQGGDKMIRAFRDNPAGTAVRVAASITLPSVLLAIANHDDPRLKEVPQWQKDLFWTIPTDSGIWRIPKPFELGIIFGSIPERVTNFILDNDPKAFDKIIETFTRGFSPGMIPTIATPILENWANKSFFFDRSIVPSSREELLPQYQYGEYTTETAKALGRLVGYFPGVGDSSAASPAYIENLVRGWTGGLGKYALDILDFGMKSTGITEKGYQEPSKTMADIPFIKAFAVRFPSSNTASIEKFYDNYKKAKEVEKTFKVLMEKEQKPQEAIKLWQEMGGADLDGVQKALGSMRNAIDLIHKHPDIKPEEKRQLIDTIYLQMIQIAKTGNEFYDSFDETRKRGIE